MRVQNLPEWHAVRHHWVRLLDRRESECASVRRPQRRTLHVGAAVDALGAARGGVDDECIPALVAEQRRRRRDVGNASAIG